MSGRGGGFEPPRWGSPNHGSSNRRQDRHFGPKSRIVNKKTPLEVAPAAVEPVRDHPELALVAAELLWLCGHCDDTDAFLAAALPIVSAAYGGDCAILAAVDSGHWVVSGQTGRIQPLPVELLAEALDSGQGQTTADWLVAPLAQRCESGELLAMHSGGDRNAHSAEAFAALAFLFGSALATVRFREHGRRRILRLEAILEIAGQWNQTHEMEPLLTQMAETSTRLLGAERASIFLWDRPNKTLVGRPALGVEGGELRIADDRGIVGQVVQTGEPRRVDAESNQDEIDREVDKQLRFETKTLLCVPLRGKSGQLFGAFEMINKRDGNFTDEDRSALIELAAHAAIALENTQEYEQLLMSRRQMAEQAAEQVQLVGESPPIQALRSTVRRVADTDLAILILGENGTGKEVVSQMIHYLSSRRDEPFVAVNCAALTETLLESELFGHEKGAFTDAHESRAGKFELASGGTLFLDEIGDLTISGQAKLLRVLEEKVVVRVGGSIPIHTNARVVAATNQDLAAMVREKRFREDLFFRLNVVVLELAPMRDRADDVLLLAEHFLRDFCAKARRKPPAFTAAARKRLLSHTWPGNVREIRNLMERLAYLLQGDKIDEGDLAFICSPDEGPADLSSLRSSLSEATSQFQIEYIKRHIKNARGNMSDAAKRLGLHRSNLYRKMRQLGMLTGEESQGAE